MTIIGHGLDVVDAERLICLPAGALSAWEHEIFTTRETNEVSHLLPGPRIKKLCGKFAVKEAIYKSVGGTSTAEIAWPEIEILTEASGRPFVEHAGAWLLECQKIQVQFAISISYTGSLCFGSAIAFQAIKNT